MSESVLYRKYRPKLFKEVLGQEQAVKVLDGAIKLGNIAHAYLFAGSRGTGKTSVARIVAKEIGATANDIYEIDAASNRGIEDIRELREGVNILPLESKFKVYIIDEVHMLTKEAFNALLKTLEEPPKHAVFILATTELDRLPETVISRCQVFQFKKPGREILKASLLAIAKKERFELSPSAAELISLLGDGSFRDAQGILQKVMSFSADNKISVEEVETVTGAPRAKLVNDFISAIDARALKDGMKAVHKASEDNVDMKIFIRLVLQKIRFVLLLRYAKDMEDAIKNEISPDDFSFLKKLSEKNTITSAALSEFLGAYNLVGRAYISELPLELSLIKLLSDDSRPASK